MKKIFLFLLTGSLFISCKSNHQKIISSLLSDYLKRYIEDTMSVKAFIAVENIITKENAGQTVSDLELIKADTLISHATNYYVCLALNDIISNQELQRLGVKDAMLSSAIDETIKAAKESGNSQDIPGLIEMKEKINN